MKPAPFEYVAPTSVDETLQALSAYGEEAKLLAGGQSLMPLLNMRLSTPAVIVDINGLTELDYIRQEADEICIGALTRQYVLEQHPLIRRSLPVLPPVVQLIGHPAIRHAGTIGGSLVHADPAAELPAAMCALQATFKLVGPAGERIVASDDFFLGLLTVDLQPDELLVEIRVPIAQPTHWGIREYTRRAGDFALAGAVTGLDMTDDHQCEHGRVVLFGVGDGPVRARGAEALLTGQSLSTQRARDVAAAAVEALDCEGDMHASADYRKHLAQVMTYRALIDALAAGLMRQ